MNEIEEEEKRLNERLNRYKKQVSTIHSEFMDEAIFKRIQVLEESTYRSIKKQVIFNLSERTGINQEAIEEIIGKLVSTTNGYEWEEVAKRYSDTGLVISAFNHLKEAIENSQDENQLAINITKVINDYAQLNSLIDFVDGDEGTKEQFFKDLIKNGDSSESSIKFVRSQVRPPHYESVLFAFSMILFSYYHASNIDPCKRIQNMKIPSDRIFTILLFKYDLTYKEAVLRKITFNEIEIAIKEFRNKIIGKDNLERIITPLLELYKKNLIYIRNIKKIETRSLHEYYHLPIVKCFEDSKISVDKFNNYINKERNIGYMKDKNQVDWITGIAVIIFLGGLLFTALKAFNIIDPPDPTSWLTNLVAIITIGTPILALMRNIINIGNSITDGFNRLSEGLNSVKDEIRGLRSDFREDTRMMKDDLIKEIKETKAELKDQMKAYERPLHIILENKK